MKKRMLLLAAMVLMLLLPWSAMAEFAFVQLGTEVYMEPDAASRVIGQYDAGTWVELAGDGAAADTALIAVIGPDGVEGCVPVESLFIASQVSADQIVVVANQGKYVNLRAEASKDGQVLAKVNSGTPMLLLETGKSFDHVSVGGIDGYMVSGMVKTGFKSIATPVVYSKNGKNVNLRSEPTMNGDILASVPCGTSVNVLMLGGGWSYIRYKNIEGYMMSKFLTSAPTPVPGPVPNPDPDSDFHSTGVTLYVSNGSSSVRYRKEPGENGKVLGKLYSGDEVYEISTNGAWSKVTIVKNGKTAYMMSRYLVMVSPDTDGPIYDIGDETVWDDSL